MFDSVQLSSSKNSRSKQHFCVNYQRPMALCVYVLGCLMTHNFFYWKSNANLGNSVVMWNMAHSPTYEQQQSEWSDGNTAEDEEKWWKSEWMSGRKRTQLAKSLWLSLMSFTFLLLFLLLTTTTNVEDDAIQCHTILCRALHRFMLLELWTKWFYEFVKNKEFCARIEPEKWKGEFCVDVECARRC